MPKLQQQKNGQFFITVDRKLARAKQWEKGKELNWIINNKGNLELKDEKFIY